MCVCVCKCHEILKLGTILYVRRNSETVFYFTKHFDLYANTNVNVTLSFNEEKMKEKKYENWQTDKLANTHALLIACM